MAILWGEVVSLATRIGHFIMGRVERNEGKRDDKEQLEEDIELANAIKRKDWKTAERIKKKRQQYSTLDAKPPLETSKKEQHEF